MGEGARLTTLENFSGKGLMELKFYSMWNLAPMSLLWSQKDHFGVQAPVAVSGSMQCLVFLADMTRILLILPRSAGEVVTQFRFLSVVLFLCILTQALSMASRKKKNPSMKTSINGKLPNVYTVVSEKTTRSWRHVSLGKERLCDMWHAQKVMNVPQSHMVARCSHHMSCQFPFSGPPSAINGTQSLTSQWLPLPPCACLILRFNCLQILFSSQSSCKKSLELVLLCHPARGIIPGI